MKPIILTSPEPNHLDMMEQWENDPENWGFGHSNIPHSRFSLEQLILQSGGQALEQKQVRFMIGVKEGQNTTYVGLADLFHINGMHLRAEVGILIAGEHRKKGYAFSAIKALKEYAFKQLWLQQLAVSIRQDNNASINLFKKAGFMPCGRKKAWYKTPDGFLDLIYMQVLNPKYHGHCS